MIQTLTIIGSILIPMLGGFGWVVSHLISIEKRLAILETIVSIRERKAGRPRKSE